MTKALTRPAKTTSINASRPKPKKARLRDMLARKRGATVAQIETELAWQPHTIRAEISRMRKGGVAVLHDRNVTPAVYRLVTPAE